MNLLTRRLWLRCFGTLLCVLSLSGALRAADAAKPLYAICGAYPPEMVALKKSFGVEPTAGFTRTVVNGLEFWRGSYEGRDILLFRTGVSMVNAAYQLQLAFDRFPITHVLFAGVAGGIDPALHVGDVVIPANWAYHGESAYLNEDPAKPGTYVIPDYLAPKIENYGMMFPTSTGVIREGDADFERMDLFPTDPALLAAARKAVEKLPPLRKAGRNVSVSVGGTGVAGTVFMDNAKYREWVFRVWKARCLDMESTALAHVAYANQKPILIVRGLSDLAGGQHGKNPIDENEGTVAEIAATVLAGIVRELP